MYELFTDRSRKVMALANQEAQRFNHEYIGTEHLLLGLVKEGSGVGASILKNMGVDLKKVRIEVEKLVKAAPEIVSVGKLPQTPRAKRCIEFAVDEAKKLGHNYIGTEHLLLGILREEYGVAANVLRNLGLELNDVRAEVLNLLGHTYEVKPQLTCVCGKPATIKITQVVDGIQSVGLFCKDCANVPEGGGDQDDIPEQITQLLQSKDQAIRKGKQEHAQKIDHDINTLMSTFLGLPNNVFSHGQPVQPVLKETTQEEKYSQHLLQAFHEAEQSLLKLVRVLVSDDNVTMDRLVNLNGIIGELVEFRDEIVKGE